MHLEIKLIIIKYSRRELKLGRRSVVKYKPNPLIKPHYVGKGDKNDDNLEKLSRS